MIIYLGMFKIYLNYIIKKYILICITCIFYFYKIKKNKKNIKSTRD